MKFCFLCNISETLRGKTIGGAELQVSLIAKALVQKGHDVVIVDFESKESFVSEDGIRVVHLPGWKKGIKGLRLFSHRLPALYKALKKEKADYYYVRTRSYFHWSSYRAAKKNNAKFIVGMAHDLDVAGFRKRFKYEYKPKFNLVEFLTLLMPNDFVFNYILKRADYVILQHAGQKDHSYKLRGKQKIFPNIFDFKNIKQVSNPTKDYFICVGSLTYLKGIGNLARLLDILNPDDRIIIVGKPRDKKSSAIYQQLTNKKNIELKGWLSHTETMDLMGNAKALINTSNYEGFPNIFLEAWASGVPVISLKVNPANVINQFGLGIYCDGNFEEMAKCIDADCTSGIDKKTLIGYIKEVHDFDTAGDRFLDLLNHN